ncbi:MAG: DUF4249 domain-containing protein [Bacteroidales bacterium]|nr:DUF4249 domain-containing protein [Bacteroidales bacterium]
MRNFIICLLVICSLMACEDQKYDFEDKYVMHCILQGGKSPKIFIYKQLDPYPDFPFNILYYDQQFFKGPYSSVEDTLKETNFCDIQLKGSGQAYTTFELKNIWLNQIPSLQPNIWGTNTPLGHRLLQYFTSDRVSVKPGGQYTIQVDAYKRKDYHSAKEHSATLKATTTIPSKVEAEIDLSSFNAIIDTNYLGDTIIHHEYTCIVSFQDDASNNDYYYVLPYRLDLDSKTNINSVNIDSIWMLPYEQFYDAFTSYNFSKRWEGTSRISGIDNEELDYRGYFLSDQKFNGQEKRIVITSKDYNRDTKKRRYLCFEIFHITEDFYKYYVQYRKQRSYSGYDVTSEPVQIYSNIENGLGLFAGISLTRKVVELKSSD